METLPEPAGALDARDSSRAVSPLVPAEDAIVIDSSFESLVKALADIGYKPPEKWLPAVVERLQTATGRRLAEDILQTSWDNWWFKHLG